MQTFHFWYKVCINQLIGKTEFLLLYDVKVIFSKLVVLGLCLCKLR